MKRKQLRPGFELRSPYFFFYNDHLCINLLLYSHVPYHNDTIIKTQEDFFNKIFVPLTLL